MATLADGAWHGLAFARIPGNLLAYAVRQALRWSRGRPELWQEPKAGLFDYLGPAAAAGEARAADLSARYRLEGLERLSTASLYRKNLYLLDILEKAAEGLAGFPARLEGIFRAADVGSQDWHYVHGLERWLRHWDSPGGREVELTGIEVDGHGVYADLHSRRDYAEAYAEQTGNPHVRYEVGDFLRTRLSGLDLVTVFYPFVTRYALLLWGLPLHLFSPARLVAKAAEVTRPGGWLMVFNHTAEEHRQFLELGRVSAQWELLREGRALSDLVDFHAAVEDRRFSIWRRRE